uniref:Reverse transcriptase domain-containing protein n=1 Tax=Tanacetum cinerariifolium TaxID=118510 RepID=A0A6L2NE74_TANCI|nr:reverse transcriptase domain-containing protein [Tanacetum cinerariifolium]
MSLSTHHIIVSFDSDVKDAFSSTTILDSPGNTSHDFSEDPSKDLLASLTISPFHDDPYMKIMQAYNATSNESPIPPPLAPITPPTVLPSSPVLSSFNSRDFFLPEKILPPQKRARFLSSSSSEFSAPPHVFEIGESYHMTHLERHEEQIETILNHLDELPLERIEHMEDKIEGLGNGRRKQMRHDDEIVLASVRIATLEMIIEDIQQLGQNNKIALARSRINDLEQIIKEIQACHQADKESLLSSEGVVGLIRWFERTELVFSRSNCTKDCKVKFATEEAVNIAQRLMDQVTKHTSVQVSSDHKRKFDDRRTFNNNNNYRNTTTNNRYINHQPQQNIRQETFRSYAATLLEYSGYTRNRPLCTEDAVGLIHWFERTELVFSRSNCTDDCKVKFATGTLTEEALSWWNSFAQPIGIEEAYKITWFEFKKLLIKKYCPQTKIKKMEDEFYNLTVKGNDHKTYIRRFQELVVLCPTMVPNSKKLMEVFIRVLQEGCRSLRARVLTPNSISILVIYVTDINKRKKSKQKPNKTKLSTKDRFNEVVDTYQDPDKPEDIEIVPDKSTLTFAKRLKRCLKVNKLNLSKMEEFRLDGYRILGNRYMSKAEYDYNVDQMTIAMSDDMDWARNQVLGVDCKEPLPFISPQFD